MTAGRTVARVLIAHNPVGCLDDPSTADVLAQVEMVESALAALGVPATRLAVAGWRVWDDVAAAAPEPGAVIFNLVEAPPGLPSVHPATAAALEALGLPFSGASAACLWLTTDKLATRAVLAAAGLPVAPGGRLEVCDKGDEGDASVLDRVQPPWILKPCREEASLGLEGDSVCASRDAALRRAAELRRRFPGQAVVVERFLPGRELNVSLLATPDGAAAALPVAEIEFVDFPPEMPRIVGYEAKWLPESFAYSHTVRRFPRHPANPANPADPAGDRLLDRVRQLALDAWNVCGLEGYGRVDLRLDEHGAPHILEVNANPCLAADAGFMAAAGEAGLSPAQVVGRILAAAVLRRSRRSRRSGRSDRGPRRGAVGAGAPDRGGAAWAAAAAGAVAGAGAADSPQPGARRRAAG
jgi:D-alanine-D-alanine ligase